MLKPEKISTKRRRIQYKIKYYKVSKAVFLRFLCLEGKKILKQNKN